MEDKYKIANFKRAYTILNKYKANKTPEELSEEFRNTNSQYHKLLNNVDKCIPDYVNAIINQKVSEHYNPESDRTL